MACLGLWISIHALGMCARGGSTGMANPGGVLAWSEYGVQCRRKWPVCWVAGIGANPELPARRRAWGEADRIARKPTLIDERSSPNAVSVERRPIGGRLKRLEN